MDADDSTLAKLVNQCKTGDVDAKIDAVSKLQTEFENGAEINDPEPLINALKACLRISNQHLTTATLSALPSLLPLLLSRSVHSRQPRAQSPAASTSSSASSIIDTFTLRQTLLAFLPSPGIIDRLGDSREKAREKARETLVILGGMAFRSGSGLLAKGRDGKGPETPLQIFERFLKDSGFLSKVWRVREQSILTLVHIRRAHHLFPLRAYLSPLIAAIEDQDANVRECARQSVVELFTGPGITDTARSDLKKELIKQNVRKQAAEQILARVFSGGAGAGTASGVSSDAGSEDGDVRSTGPAGKKSYVPPSLALMNRSKSGPPVSLASGRAVSHSGSTSGIPSRPASRAAMVVSPPPSTPSGESSGSASVKPVYIASSRDLENEFAGMEKPFEGKETEHNWQLRDRAITRVRGMIKAEVHIQYTETFFSHLKQFLNWSLKTLLSLRTTVVTNTCAMYNELAITLGPSLDPFCDTLYVNLLKMASLTKKIAAQTSQDTVTVLMNHTSAQPRMIIPLLWTTLQDKNTQARVYAISHVKTYLDVHGLRSKYSIEGSGGHDILEKCLKKGLADPNPGVRTGSRSCFWSFEAVWHEKGQAILAASDSTVRKALENDCPNPQAATVLPPKTPVAKKSSVAAAIAATRAKAKAVATAPPSLRHQATSTAHAVRATSPPANHSTSPVSSGYGRATSPVTPPSPPRSRVMSAGARTIGRSTSYNTVPGSQHARAASGPSGRAASPTSPVSPTSAYGVDPYGRKRGSPLGSPTGVRGLSELRKAMHTALPASPESTTAYVMPTPSAGRSSFELRRAMQTALPASPEHSTGYVPATAPRSVGRPTPGNNRAAVSSVVPIVTSRHSLLMPKMTGDMDDDSLLLLATKIPVPEDDDEDMDIDQSINLISFSTPYELYPPAAPPSATDSALRTPISPKSTDNLLASPSGEQVIEVEDAMRARAEQAESAAERLLELVDPDEDGTNPSPIPPSLLPSKETPGTVKVKVKAGVAAALRNGGSTPPITPANRNTAILKQAALFQDSPAYNGKSASLLDVLKDRKHETGWWLKRMTLVDQGTPLKARNASESANELEGYIAALQSGEGDVRAPQKLALFCTENPVADPVSNGGFDDPDSPFVDKISTLSGSSELWVQEKRFVRLLNALIAYLDPAKPENELEYGLIVLWEMLENQAPLLEGHESEVFRVMLEVRYCNKLNVLEATNTIRDAITTRLEPVYGVTTLHANLRTFLAATPPAFATPETKAGIYAFGLVAMGKFILRLPADIIEDELPRLRATLIAALNDTTSLIVRESAVACIIAAQLVLRDETHLFALLDGLADEKKNLLTYLFDKHGARGFDQGSSGMERLEREMRRLDTRTSTPVKGGS